MRRLGEPASHKGLGGWGGEDVAALSQAGHGKALGFDMWAVGGQRGIRSGKAGGFSLYFSRKTTLVTVWSVN